jgi:riboflavin biosynthesis pyrimidine reductase
LRKEFGAILIGGNTARNEPYSKTPIPLIVVSSRALSGSALTNPLALLWDLPLPAAIGRATELYGDLLIEAGPVLVKAALAEGLLTELYLTISDSIGGENPIAAAELTAGASEISREKVEGGLFLHYRLAPSHD